MKLQYKTVLVTGSSRGIGKAIAVEFAKSGCHVVLNASKSAAELNHTCNEIKAMGYQCHCFLGDVSDYKVCQNMFEEINKTYGPVDILVNNAAISHVGLFTDMTPIQWKLIMDANLYSVFNCSHLALPPMVQKCSGSIINISSMWGERGASCEAVYSASKGAVNSFTKAMAKEVGPSGVRVNAISCGVFHTQMNAWLNDDEKQQLIEDISLLRFGKTEEVAKLAVFLAGESSEYITGQIISIDGGII